MQQDDQLETLLELEEHLQEHLHAAGHRFYLEAAARIRHMSDSSLRVAMCAMFGRGRQFGSDRSRSWSWPRKLGYVLASPLFPFICLYKLRVNLARFRREHRVAPLVPHLCLMMATVVVGECTGYLFGPGQTNVWMARHEYDLALRLNRREIREMNDLVRQRAASMAAVAAAERLPDGAANHDAA